MTSKIPSNVFFNLTLVDCDMLVFLRYTYCSTDIHNINFSGLIVSPPLAVNKVLGT